MNGSTQQVEPGTMRGPASVIQTADALLLISSVTKRWPRQEQPVLRGIDFALGAGEVAWLTGENGAGKTTLLRIIAGIIAPNAGNVSVCGLESHGARRAYQQCIGLLTAGNSGLYARMNVRQHLDYWARLALVAPDRRRERVEESIGRFELEAFAKRRLDRMSMGQRQRVRIAMTFLHRPALILLDEPANSLDDEGLAMLLGAIEEHCKAGGSTLWCSPGGDGPGLVAQHKLQLVAGRLERHG